MYAHTVTGAVLVDVEVHDYVGMHTFTGAVLVDVEVQNYVGMITFTGAVLVDVEVQDYVGMMQAVVDQLVCRKILDEHQREYVMQALILRHSHLDGKAKFARSKSYGNLMGLDSMSR